MNNETDTPKGRGFGNYIKGERVTDIATLHTGDLLLRHSTQFKADNTILVSRELQDRVYAHFVNPEDWTEREGEDFCIWGHELETDEVYRAEDVRRILSRGTIEDDPAPVPEPEPVTTSHTFTVDVKEFRAALEMAVTEKKTTIPILQNVCLQAQGSFLRILSTDLDKWAVTDVPATVDDGAAMFLLPQRQVLNLLKGETGILKLTASITTLKNNFSHCWVKLEVGGCEYDVPSMYTINFPVFPEVPKVDFTVTGEDLKATLGRVMVAISSEVSRYTMNGALFESGSGNLIVAGTDGHRLALDSIPVQNIPTSKAIIHRDALGWLYKHGGSGRVDVSLGEDQSFFTLYQSRTTLISRNVKGQFPDYRKVSPRKDDINLTASFPSGADLAKTLAKVARMADERSGAVKWAVNGSCVLSAESTETGKASATVKSTITHSDDVPEIVTAFNSEYVLDALKVAGKNPIVLSLKDARSAGVFTIPSLPEYSYTIMPMRI